MTVGLLRVEAAKPMEIAKRFSPYLGIVLVASFIYWLAIWVAFVALTKSTWGDTPAQIAGAVVAAILVAGGMFAYARWICMGLSKSKLVIGSDSFVIAAQQKFRVNEYEFPFSRTQRVVFGQPLSTMETLFDELNQLGIPHVSMSMNKDLRAGRLFAYEVDGKCTAFQFLDKAFAEEDLLQFFAALHAQGVAIEAGIEGDAEPESK